MALQDSRQTPLPTIDILSNGIRVIADPIPSAGSVALGIWVRAGTLDEQEGEAGIAHLLEHMAFKGTVERSARDIALEVENIGASLDAATSHQRTGYYTRLLPDDLPLMMDMLSDIIRSPVFEESELAREKHVVIQEIMEAADDPVDQVFEALSAVCWGDQPLGRPILGTRESVMAHERTDINSFIARTYKPEEMIIAVSGAISHDEIPTLSEKYFGDFTGYESESVKIAKIDRQSPIYRGGLVETYDQTEQVHIAIAYEGYGYSNSRYVVARLLADIWGGGMSSRLFHRIREEHGFAYSVYAFADIFDQAGLIGAYCGTSVETCEKVVQLMRDELVAMADHVSQDELDRARAIIKASTVMSRESLANRIEIFSGQVMTFGELRYRDEILEEFNRITIDDISALAHDLIHKGNPSLSIIGPDNENIDGAGLLDILRGK